MKAKELKNSKNISALKANKDKVELDNENMAEGNQQQLANMDVTDNLKYSMVDVYIKEPKSELLRLPLPTQTVLMINITSIFRTVLNQLLWKDII